MSDTATPVLTAQDRCDRCAAQAFVRHEKGDLTIDLCAHHDKANHAALHAQGFLAVIDNTDALAPGPNALV